MEYTIYSITCKDVLVTGIYVGSTSDFYHRENRHKSHSNDEKKTSKLYDTIRANGGWVNWEFKILESFTCEKYEALIRERYYIDKLQSDLNTNMPYRSLEEYKFFSDEANKQYRVNNKEEIKQYYVENKRNF